MACESTEVTRSHWDHDAERYVTAHSDYLAAPDGTPLFYWCPERLEEKDAHLLGETKGKRIIEFGAGSAPCARWLSHHTDEKHRPLFVTASDLSFAMLTASGNNTTKPALVQADARALPYADNSFDIAFTAYGAISFVPDPEKIFHEVNRILIPGGKFVFSVSHPVRWMFSDEAGDKGLTLIGTYFDRSPYEERDPLTGKLTYIEYTATMGQRIHQLSEAGFNISSLIEPEWPDGCPDWAQFTKIRGKVLPSTAIFVCRSAT